MAASASSFPLNILVVDDDPFAAMVLTELFRSCFIDGEGMVESCETINECQEKCAQGQVYDAVRVHATRALGFPIGRSLVCARTLRHGVFTVAC